MFVTDVKPTLATRQAATTQKAAKNNHGRKKFSLDYVDELSVQVVSGLTPVAMAPIFSNKPHDHTPPQKHLKRGYALLNELENIRLALLTGTLSLSDLKNLMQTIQTQPHTVEEPNLAAIVREIEIRAAVELAKHEAAVELA
jgi:hypothetical protein